MVAILTRGSVPNGARSFGLALAMATAASAACGGRSVSTAGERESSGASGGTLDASASGGAVATGGIAAGSVGGSSGGIDAGSNGGEASGGTAGGAGTSFDPFCRGGPPGPCREGHVCGPLVCGLADSGTRTCTCTEGQWGCTACDFSNSMFRDPPAFIPPCPPDAADEILCSELGTVCGVIEVGEVCACWDSPSDGRSWDCDDPPSTWRL